MAAIEAPSMVARIFLIRKLNAAALPLQTDFVFGHGLYMECEQALGNRAALPDLDPAYVRYGSCDGFGYRRWLFHQVVMPITDLRPYEL